MNKTVVYAMLLCSMLLGCTVRDVAVSNELDKGKSTIDYQENIRNLNENNLFSYMVRIDSGPSTLEGIPGRFEWKDRCLVFVLELSNEIVTPIFPVQSTNFDNSNQLISISRSNYTNKYLIGENIVLGGAITESTSNRVTLTTKGSDECLMNKTITIL